MILIPASGKNRKWLNNFKNRIMFEKRRYTRFAA